MQPDYSAARSGAVLAPAQHRVLRNTYWLLAITLVPTAIGAAVGVNLDLSFMRANPIISVVAVLAIFYGWIFAIERNRNSVLGRVERTGLTASRLAGNLAVLANVGPAAGSTEESYAGGLPTGAWPAARWSLTRTAPSGPCGSTSTRCTRGP